VGKVWGLRGNWWRKEGEERREEIWRISIASEALERPRERSMGVVIDETLRGGLGEGGIGRWMYLLDVYALVKTAASSAEPVNEADIQFFSMIHFWTERAAEPVALFSDIVSVTCGCA